MYNLNGCCGVVSMATVGVHVSAVRAAGAGDQLFLRSDRAEAASVGTRSGLRVAAVDWAGVVERPSRSAPDHTRPCGGVRRRTRQHGHDGEKTDRQDAR